jgi:hypothetical protein
MDITALLKAKHDALLSSYRDHIEAVHTIQTTLLERILPNILEDPQGVLYDKETIDQCREWINDTGACHAIVQRRQSD